MAASILRLLGTLPFEPDRQEVAMYRPVAVSLFSVWTSLLATCVCGPAHPQTEVDMTLILAVDASHSVDPDEEYLQRYGYVEAFRSPMIHRAIQSGILGQIATTYFEWSGTSGQWIIVPWTVIREPEQAVAFAKRLADQPYSRSYAGTSLSGAIDFGLHLLLSSPFPTSRQVIDISGDGINNSGRWVTQARNEAVSKGITINGLVLMLKRASGAFEIDNLDEYYRDCVIGGLGAFMIPVRERSEFAEAIKLKIVQEITGLSPEAAVQNAQAQAKPRSNCFEGSDTIVPLR